MTISIFGWIQIQAIASQLCIITIRSVGKITKKVNFFPCYLPWVQNTCSMFFSVTEEQMNLHVTLSSVICSNIQTQALVNCSGSHKGSGNCWFSFSYKNCSTSFLSAQRWPLHSLLVLQLLLFLHALCLNYGSVSLKNSKIHS